MFKTIRFVYEAGRRQAYTKIIAELERLAFELPRNREGQLLRRNVDETIEKIKKSVYEAKNGKK